MDYLDDRQTEECLAQLLQQGTHDYLSRGRRFQTTELRVLKDLWIAAFRDVFMNDRSDSIPDMDDLTVELSLRDVAPPCEEIAAEIGIQAREARLMPDDLKTADEVFITGTTREITPVVRIDDLTIGSGKPGTLTNKLLAEFRLRAEALTREAARA